MLNPPTNSATSVTLLDESCGSIAVIAPQRGAIVTSFSVGSCEALYLDTATFDDPNKNVRGGIPVLFPIAGKLEQDRWRSHGREGSMKQHGFARTLPWNVAAASPTQATLTLESNASTLAQYPWKFRAELEYALKGHTLRATLRVHNTDDTTLPFALGFHPYFQVDDKAQAHIGTDATQAFDNVAKRTVAFKGFDLTAPEVDLHLLDHKRAAATLRLGDGPSITVRASPQFTTWVVWTLQGKDFVCLEPWTSPANALNSDDRLVTVPPGQERELWMEIEYR